MLSAKQRGKHGAAAADDDDGATQATTQDSRWRAGVNRQAQAQAQQHQVAASQAAAAKRTASAMTVEERKVKRAARARELYAQQAAKRAVVAEVARAEAAAARLPTRKQLNRCLKEEGDEAPCDRDEWDAFEEYTMNALDVGGFLSGATGGLDRRTDFRCRRARQALATKHGAENRCAKRNNGIQFFLG